MAFDSRIQVFGWEAGQDGSTFYRISEPLRNLNPDRFVTLSSEEMPRKWPHFDVIHGLRIARSDDQAAPVLRWQEVCNDRDILSIYDIDDNLFCVPEHNFAHKFFSSSEVKRNIAACAAMADICLTSTEPLANVMRKYNPHTLVIPNYIDESVLEIPRPDHGDTVVVGWAGSGTHDADFAQIKPHLFTIAFSNPNVRFAIMGGNYGADLPPERTLRAPWTKSPRRIYKKMAIFDIGIAPLINDEFNESKSHIKALEYAALGIPCVASKVPAYEDFVAHEVTGFLAENPIEFADAIQELVTNRDLREKMGRAAREHARTYTIQANIHKYERIYQQ